MSDPRDMPRVTVNWTQFRPQGWRGWIAAAGFLAVAIAHDLGAEAIACAA